MSTSSHPNLVSIPRLTALALVALARSVLTVFLGLKKLPAGIAAAAAKVKVAQRELSAVTGRRFRAEPVDPQRARKAHLAVVAAWKALLNLLSSMAALPAKDAESAEGSALMAALFPDGLTFLVRKAFASEWAEVDQRLTTIADDKLESRLDALGATKILAHIRETQEEYGAALGITAVAPDAPETDAVQTARLKLQTALNTYVLRVAANVDEDDPATQKLADQLLAPIRDFKVPAPAAAKTPSAPESARQSKKSGVTAPIAPAQSTPAAAPAPAAASSLASPTPAPTLRSVPLSETPVTPAVAAAAANHS